MASSGLPVDAEVAARAPSNWQLSTVVRGVVVALALGGVTALVIAHDLKNPYTGGVPFNGALFVTFFAWFYVLYHFVAGSSAQRLWLITVGSLLFYASWGIQWVPLILATGFVDFFLAKGIAKAEDPGKKKRLLALSVGMNLLVLAAIKYSNFVVANVYLGLETFGVRVAPPVFSFAMPIGISFYTFQAISYTVDVYRGNFEPRKQLHEFIAGLTFFPHLAAGPIVRSSYLLPQFEALAPPKWIDCRRAFLLIATGLLNKTIADLLAFAVDPVFGAHEPRGALATWTAVLAFGGQVYGDFCGYTDMATGVALLLGFTLPPNFDLPYLSRSPAEFWRRWHISLSTWLRDYLWFPLARRYPSARYSTLVITMFLAGLWHGAGWTFAMWGLYHGLLLVVNHALAARLGRRVYPRWVAALQWLLTTYLVFVGFVMFRSSSFSGLASLLREMHAPVVASSFAWEPVMMLVLVASGLVAGHVVSWMPRQRSGSIERSPLLWLAVVLFFGLSFAAGRIGQSFLYFQF